VTNDRATATILHSVLVESQMASKDKSMVGVITKPLPAVREQDQDGLVRAAYIHI
jgi:hypothetical protein